MRSRSFSKVLTYIGALTVAASLASPAVGLAQQEPYPQQPPTQQQQNYPQQQPTYAQPPPAPAYGRQNAIKGTVSGFDGQWIVYMHDDKGYTDHITLHQGTVINPTGIKLLEGMRVTIYGNPDGPTFQANRVDVAYSPYSPYYGADGNPAYGYGDNGYGYGGDGGYGGSGYGYGGGGYYPGGGYGYGYPYGLSLGINWGWGWGWGWPGYWGYPGYWGGYPYYGGYYPGYYGGYCCGYRGGGWYHPGPGWRGGRISAPVNGGTVRGGTYRGGTFRGGTVRGGMPGGGGGGHAPVSGGRPPRS